MKLKAGIYDPYLDTLGGGERYSLTVAEVLSQHGYQVDVFWSGNQQILQLASNRFSLDLSQVRLTPDIFQHTPSSIDNIDDPGQIKKCSDPTHNCQPFSKKINHFIRKFNTTRQYDLFFYLSDGSLPLIQAKTNLLHFQVPFITAFSKIQKSINLIKLKLFQQVICNSAFTKSVIDKNYGSQSTVLYPPVDVAKFYNSSQKENIILSVGRFDNILNSKKQDVLIDAFLKLPENLQSSWCLILAGGSLQDESDNRYLQILRSKSQNKNIKIIVNPPFSQLQDIYYRSKIYWHAAGYQVDQSNHPEATEHFGMTVVEAMAGGLVPVVVNRGGLPEIVSHNQNGFLWESIEQLNELTMKLIADEQLMSRISNQASADSFMYSKESFSKQLIQLIRR